MMKSCFLLTTAFLVSALAPAQVLVPGKTAKQPGDIDHVEATRKSELFAQLIGLEAQSRPSVRGFLSKNHRKNEAGRVWHLSGPLYTFFVNSVTGKVTLFEFSKRVEDQFKGRGRTGAVRFTKEADARQHLLNLARTLGVPANATLSSFTFTGEGHRKEQNAAGYFGAVFKVGSEVIATISCDMQDGLPTLITLRD